MFVVNKNIIHNGKSYPKDTEIKKTDDGFDELIKTGHVDRKESDPYPVSAPKPQDEFRKDLLKKSK